MEENKAKDFIFIRINEGKKVDIQSTIKGEKEIAKTLFDLSIDLNNKVRQEEK